MPLKTEGGPQNIITPNRFQRALIKAIGVDKYLADQKRNKGIMTLLMPSEAEKIQEMRENYV